MRRRPANPGEPTALILCVGATPELCAAITRAVDGGGVVLVTSDIHSALHLLAGGQGREPSLASRPRRVREVGSLRVDGDRREATWQDLPIPLSPQEFDLLYVLARDPGRVWTFAELTSEVWQTDHFGDGEAVVSAVKRLRRRLSTVTNDLQVASVRGVGFRLLLTRTTLGSRRARAAS